VNYTTYYNNCAIIYTQYYSTFLLSLFLKNAGRKSCFLMRNNALTKPPQ
jgi:hypothetical protein